MEIIGEQLKALGFKVTDRGASRLIASRPVNEKILEYGLYCDSIMSLSYREYNEKFGLKDNYIRVVLYSLHDPLENYLPAELERAEKRVVYEGLVHDYDELLRILSNTVYNKI